jgi:hypothetical protein
LKLQSEGAAKHSLANCRSLIVDPKIRGLGAKSRS